MDEDKLSESKFPSAIDMSIFKGSEFTDIVFLDNEARNALLRKVFRTLLRICPTEGQLQYAEEIQTLRQNAKGSHLSEISVEDLGSYWPLKDVVSGDDLIFCTRTQKLANISHDFWTTVVPKEIKDNIGVKGCVSKYMPLDLRRSFPGHYSPTDDDQNLAVTFVNRHIAPQWRYDKSSGETEEFQEFMEHLIPIPECRAYVLNWIRNAILNRNGTYLVLNGAKGIGKNVFTDLVKQLVGPRNYGRAPRSFLDSHFNSVLDNKRIILIDEQAINTPDKLDVLKDYINPFQNIEKKGQDAKEMVETFNSFIISNNREVDIKIESDDRRFSVIDLTIKRLLDLWREEKIDAFTKRFEDQQYLGAIGNYILNECEANFGIEEAWKGPKFRRLVETSLWEWQKYVLDTILSKKRTHYPIDTIKRRYNELRSSRKSSINRDLIKDFLSNYRHEGKLLGEVGRRDDKWAIIPSPSYNPEGISNDVEDLL
jgi:hypothetical protein